MQQVVTAGGLTSVQSDVSLGSVTTAATVTVIKCPGLYPYELGAEEQAQMVQVLLIPSTQGDSEARRHACNLSAGKAETGGSWGLTSWKPKLIGRSQVTARDLDSKM